MYTYRREWDLHLYFKVISSNIHIYVEITLKLYLLAMIRTLMSYSNYQKSIVELRIASITEEISAACGDLDLLF